MCNNDNLICIYDETKENIEDVILKIYSGFVDKELDKELYGVRISI